MIMIFNKEGKDNMNEFMIIAKTLADGNLITNLGGPFGACVVKDGEIIGMGSIIF